MVVSLAGCSLGCLVLLVLAVALIVHLIREGGR
jgi:hypothetical protein